MDGAAGGAGQPLVHPLYMDLAMMAGLLAQIRASAEEHPDELQQLDDVLTLRGKEEGDRGVGTLPDTSYLAAGLFHFLHRHLGQAGQLLSPTTADDLDDLECGQLIELEGANLGNPLEDMLGFFGAVVPQVLEQEALRNAIVEELRQQTRGRSPSRGGGAQKRTGTEADQATRAVEILGDMADQIGEDVGARLVLSMAHDISNQRVHDLVVDAGELRAVLTISVGSLAPDAYELLKDARVRVVGKITAVIDRGERIDLTRRTAVGGAGADLMSELVSSARSAPYQLKVSEPVVEGPAVQLLPMAILI